MKDKKMAQFIGVLGILCIAILVIFFVLNQNSEVHENVYGLGHTPLYKDMIDAINNDREPYVSAEAGYRALELVLAVYLSSKEHRIVKLPLDESVSTLDFKGLFD